MGLMEPCPGGLYLSVDQLALGSAALHLSGGRAPLFKGKVLFEANFLRPGDDGNPDIQKGLVRDCSSFFVKKRKWRMLGSFASYRLFK